MRARARTLVKAALSRRVLTVLAFTLMPRAAAGQSGVEAPPVTLQWIAPSGCPSDASVLADVQRILGPEPSASGRKSVRARALVSRTGHGRWVVALTTRTGSWTGERSFSADSCKALAEATALILALTVDPARASQSTVALGPTTSTEASSPPSPASPSAPSASTPSSPSNLPSTSPPTPSSTSAPASPSSTPSTPSKAPPATSAPTPAPASPEKAPRRPPSLPSTPATPHHFALGGSATADSGSLPNAAFGAELSLAWLPGRFRAEIAAQYWAAETATLAGRPTEGGQFQLLSAGARGCFAIVTWPLELSPCAALAVSSMSAQGFGSSSIFETTGSWLSAGGGALAAWSLLREVALRFDFELLVPLSRPSFVVESASGGQSVHQPAGLAGRGAIGLELRFF